MEGTNSINKSKINISRVSKPTASSTGSNVPPAGNGSPLPMTRVGLSPLHSLSPVRAVPIQYREQDHYMPIANVIRLMRRVLPSNIKITDEAKETVQECVSEFISFVSDEANDMRKVDKRKVITADDLVSAMSRLGFDNYVDPLLLYLKRYREVVGKDHPRTPRVKLLRPTAVGPAVMVPLPVADPDTRAGEGIGGGVGGGIKSSTNMTSFDVGSCSNDNVLGSFDAFDDLLPPRVTSPSNNVASNNCKGGAQEVEAFDPFVEFK